MIVRTLILSILLTACTQENTAVIEKRGSYVYQGDSGTSLSRKDSEEQRQRRLYKIVDVRSGDTLYSISERYNVELREVIEYNDFKPPYEIEKGQKIRLPRPQFYEVMRGDTLYEISEKKGVDVSRLASLNELKTPYTLEQGQRLRLPFRTHNDEVTEKTFAEAIPVKEVKIPKSPAIEVEELDPLNKIAKNPKVDQYKPRKLRYVLTDPDGQVKHAGDSEPEAKATPQQASVPKPVRKPLKQPRRSLTLKKGKFMWPVDGSIISSFGPKRGGVYNDGINISAPYGANVFATASGEVIYSGSGLGGYGKLVIIRHAGGWLSAYAHNNEILVRRGQKVKQGEVIAQVGDSGRVGKPQLHFGLRKGRKVVDPKKYLPG